MSLRVKMTCVLARLKMTLSFQFDRTFALIFTEFGDVGHGIDVLIVERIEHIIPGVDVLVALKRLLLMACRQ